MKESTKEVSGNIMECCISSAGGGDYVETKMSHVNLRKKVLLSERTLISGKFVKCTYGIY